MIAQAIIESLAHELAAALPSSYRVVHFMQVICIHPVDNVPEKKRLRVDVIMHYDRMHLMLTISDAFNEDMSTPRQFYDLNDPTAIDNLITKITKIAQADDLAITISDSPLKGLTAILELAWQEGKLEPDEIDDAIKEHRLHHPYKRGGSSAVEQRTFNP